MSATFIQAQLDAADNRFLRDGGNLRSGSRSPGSGTESKKPRRSEVFQQVFLRLVTVKHTALRQHMNYMSNPEQAQILGIFTHFEYGTFGLFLPNITV